MPDSAVDWKRHPLNVLMSVLDARGVTYERFGLGLIAYAPGAGQDELMRLIEQSDIDVKHQFDKPVSQMKLVAEEYEKVSLSLENQGGNLQKKIKATNSKISNSIATPSNEGTMTQIANANEKRKWDRIDIRREMGPRPTNETEEGIAWDATRKEKLDRIEAMFKAETKMAYLSEDLKNFESALEEIQTQQDTAQASAQKEWQEIAENVHRDCGVDFGKSHTCIEFVNDKALAQKLQSDLDLAFKASIGQDLKKAKLAIYKSTYPDFISHDGGIYKLCDTWRWSGKGIYMRKRPDIVGEKTTWTSCSILRKGAMDKKRFKGGVKRMGGLDFYRNQKGDFKGMLTSSAKLVDGPGGEKWTQEIIAMQRSTSKIRNANPAANPSLSIANSALPASGPEGFGSASEANGGARGS